ncbi:MAG: HAD-IG family 5'-nucleotidase [Myxococcales bacterium]|nr:HAD-IG family 5'-nucleotidase [Myxococcales bacterium]
MQLSLPLPELAQLAHGGPPRLVDRVYCNRSLRLDQIDWVGFDMDYTLAVYDQVQMDRLSIEATLAKLVEQRGYPASLREATYRTDFPIRGLLVDRRLGNVLKMDRYKYVKRAYHGLTELTKDERRHAYHTRRLKVETARYHWVDTLYALSEVAVYAAAVEHLEQRATEDDPLDYDRLFGDVRECIDLSHQDGTILDHILADMPRFVHRDPLLPRTLHQLRSSGKRIFLLTNSQAPYTERMMSYLLGEGLPQYRGWRGYFDLVLCAARKPRFFTGDAPFEEILPSGERRPVPLVEVLGGFRPSELPPSPYDTAVGTTAPGTLDAPSASGDVTAIGIEAPPRARFPIGELPEATHAPQLERGKVYVGGNLLALQLALGTTPDRVLYVGDHIYGDVLRAKKETAWRTVMVIQEMEDELLAHGEVEHSLERLDALEEQRLLLLEELRDRQILHKALERRREANKGELPPAEDADRVRHRRAIDRLRARLRLAERELDELERGVDHRFHRFWGSLFKAGPEVSSFGHQVETYACLYTARVSNLQRYSPMHYFMSPRDRMPHELRSESFR